MGDLRETITAVDRGETGRSGGSVEGNGGSPRQREGLDSGDIRKGGVDDGSGAQHREGVSAAAADHGVRGELLDAAEPDEVVRAAADNGDLGRALCILGDRVTGNSTVDGQNACLGGVGAEGDVGDAGEGEGLDAGHLGKGRVIDASRRGDEECVGTASAGNHVGGQLGSRADDKGVVTRAAAQGEGRIVTVVLDKADGAITGDDIGNAGQRGGRTEGDGGGRSEGEGPDGGDLREIRISNRGRPPHNEGIGSTAADEGIGRKLGAVGDRDDILARTARDGEGSGEGSVLEVGAGGRSANDAVDPRSPRRGAKGDGICSGEGEDFGAGDVGEDRVTKECPGRLRQDECVDPRGALDQVVLQLGRGGELEGRSLRGRDEGVGACTRNEDVIVTESLEAVLARTARERGVVADGRERVAHKRGVDALEDRVGRTAERIAGQGGIVELGRVERIEGEGLGRLEDCLGCLLGRGCHGAFWGWELC